MMRRTEAEVEKIREVTRRYEQEGFQVVADPGPGLFPFDLGGFHPDLLVSKGEQNYLVKVRTLRAPLPVERIIEVSREVRRRPGWRFYIVTADDVHEDAPGIADPLAPWPTLRRRAADALRLAQSDVASELAVLGLWSAVEGILRKIADGAAIPIERLPVSKVIPTLYAMGELTFEHYEALRDLLEIRNRLLHGFEAQQGDVARASRCLEEVLAELIHQPVERAA